MNFFDNIGIIAIGTRLRMLSEKMTEDATKIYEMYDVDLKPKWFPVFYVLSQNSEKSITAIANEIGHSHPSVSKIVREMVKEQILCEKKDKNDGRKNNIELAPKGLQIANHIKDQYTDVQKAVEITLNQSRHNMWHAIEEFEFLLDQKSMFQRVKEEKKLREIKKVEIVPYEDKYRIPFKNLNEEWITTFFKMEETDRKSLDQPKEYILDKGGEILVALYEKEPVGVCALIKMEDPHYDFELAKMAVSPQAKGKGIGWLLGKAIIKKAQTLNAQKIYLESNTVLKPAINLYHKLGFNKVVGHSTPYERCNIQMELILD
ncbi:bifunctional helix-turn-helix transcriptional regulator/GNAT family N-acetyltransferase [Aquimarina macrocephali]|uniref:bifunctional helix-turn-helix transcriptional regulator/GNAT family N-acetyltransferase n=1 Tax=Aquimarina macrocephali TaxID=666563 RepID=UPI000463643C|nr:bifunctional helix-turn-helix transcriptional regulator/GNAT family N-acetyltransferase [Aquimarina macrocephali]